MSFESLGLAPELLRAVAGQGYTEPTAVQAEAIPLVLDGRDVLAGAQTGTGKTAAFVLPILQRLHGSAPGGLNGTEAADTPAVDPRDRRAGRAPVRCLILTPTRELAIQVEESVRTYGGQRPIRSTVIYGGVGFEGQLRALRAGPGIVVATPGRLLDHVGQGTIDLSRVEILVLDEADRMLDMGFIRDIRRIIGLLPPRRQNLLFSATFSEDIRRLADGILDRPAQVQVTPRNTTVELVRQVVHPVDRERKRELLTELITSGRIDQALVFTRTKHGASRLAEQLDRDGIPAAAIHGNKSQPQRNRALADFKSGRVAILVATDLAARGIDIDALPHVVNYELPMAPEDYLHRIGRTARAGMDGDAVSLVCIDESKLLWQIESLLRMKIPVEVVEGFAPDRSIRPQPILLRSAGGAAGRSSQPSRRGAGRGGFAPAARRPDQRPPQRPGYPSAPGQFQAHPAAGPRGGQAHPAAGPRGGQPYPAAGSRPAHPAAGPRQGHPGAGPRQPYPAAGPRGGHPASGGPRGGQPRRPGQSIGAFNPPAGRPGGRPGRSGRPGHPGSGPRPLNSLPGERLARHGSQRPDGPGGRRPDDRGR
ncbi:MAG: DEAD/DEAH box helicase [Chloroflexota bacterium]|nr:DEAD/DEAH box helicase [Chloroflexota bacterium]